MYVALMQGRFACFCQELELAEMILTNSMCIPILNADNVTDSLRLSHLFSEYETHNERDPCISTGVSSINHSKGLSRGSSFRREACVHSLAVLVEKLRPAALGDRLVINDALLHFLH